MESGAVTAKPIHSLGMNLYFCDLDKNLIQMQ